MWPLLSVSVSSESQILKVQSAFKLGYYLETNGCCHSLCGKTTISDVSIRLHHLSDVAHLLLAGVLIANLHPQRAV